MHYSAAIDSNTKCEKLIVSQWHFPKEMREEDQKFIDCLQVTHKSDGYESTLQ